jgi:CxxC motif-containing protein
MKKTLTCIECPIGCEIVVLIENDKIVSVSGNNCLRGKNYAEAEVTCPKRVITSTVRSSTGEMIPVKTDKPVRKEEIFNVMKKINAILLTSPVCLGEVLIENICDDANLIVAGNF